MGFFPSAWVFPGGHIEVDEGLDEGVQVKTAISVDKEDRKYSY